MLRSKEPISAFEAFDFGATDPETRTDVKGIDLVRFDAPADRSLGDAPPFGQSLHCKALDRRTRDI